MPLSRAVRCPDGQPNRSKWVVERPSLPAIDSGPMSPAADVCAADAPRPQQLSAVSELLLDCLRRKPLPAATAIDWDRIVSLADTHGVTELLLDRLVTAGVNLPEPTRQMLLHRAVGVTGVNLARARQVADLLQQLRDHGVRAVSFKGPALATTAYGHLGRRLSADIDLLVHPGDAARVRPFLLRHGYQLPDRRRRRAGSLIYGLYPGAGRDDTLLPIDANLAAIDVHVAFAHWRLGIRLDTPALLERAVNVEIAGLSIPTLCPDDLLLVLAIHGMMHGWNVLRYIVDIDAVVPLVSHWMVVLERARAARLGRALSVALLLAERAMLTRVPPEAAREIARDREAAELADLCLARLFDVEAQSRAWDPWPWFLAFQASPLDKMRFRVRTLIYEWLLKWPWDDWLGRRLRQDGQDEA
jgi:putative nucleotidyltransferase-like protein